MSYASTSNALNYEASVAASQSLAKLEQLMAKLEAQDAVVMRNSQMRKAVVEIAQALGIDAFTLAMASSSSDEHRNRISTAVVEVCDELQSQTGGSLPLSQVKTRLETKLARKLSTGEVERAIADLEVLGPGLRLETLPNGQQVLRSAATELSSDQGSVLAACDALGYVTSELLVDNFGWDDVRAQQVLDDMVSAGLLWVDLQCFPSQYWTPAVL